METLDGEQPLGSGGPITLLAKRRSLVPLSIVTAATRAAEPSSQRFRCARSGCSGNRIKSNININDDDDDIESEPKPIGADGIMDALLLTDLEPAYSIQQPFDRPTVESFGGQQLNTCDLELAARPTGIREGQRKENIVCE